MKKSNAGRRLSISFSILIAIVAFLLVNLASSFLLNSNIDLTENKIYTLSDGTKNLLKDIDEPINIKLYYSDNIAQGIGPIQSYAERVKGLLEQYASESDGNIVLHFIDPEPFSAYEDQALAAGLKPIPIQNGKQLFFGLVISDSVDNTKVISTILTSREMFLEYDITRLIYDLLNPKKPTIGLLNWLPASKTGEELIFFQQLSQQFQVNKIDTNAKKLPNNLDSLLIVHPQDHSIDTAMLYEIDQYLLNNGKVIAFVDPHNEDRENGTAPSSNLSKLFTPWGVEYNQTLITADMASAINVNIQTEYGVQSTSHPTWLQFGEKSFNKEDPITANLNQVRFISAGSLSLDKSADNISFSPLIKTTNQGSTISKDALRIPDISLWKRSLKPSSEPLVLAARYSGKINSAFPDKSAEKGHLQESVDSSNLIVFADVDLLFNRYWVEVNDFLGQKVSMKTADNGDLIFNAVDNMIGSSDLISLRSRGVKNRSFSVVSDLRNKAEEEFREQEDNLQTQLREAEQRINQLQQGKDTQNSMILNDEQRKEIQRFQRKRANARKELRELQLRLNREIENLGSLLKFINVILIPILLLILSLFLPSRIGRRKYKKPSLAK